MQYKINSEFSEILFGIDQETLLENRNGSIYMNGKRVSPGLWPATARALKFLTDLSVGYSLKYQHIKEGKKFKRFDSILVEVEKHLYALA